MKQGTLIIVLAAAVILYLLFHPRNALVTASGVPLGGGNVNGVHPVYGGSAGIGIGSILSGAGSLVMSLTKAFQGSPSPSPAPQPSYAPLPTNYASATDYSAITDAYGNVIS